MRNVQGYVCGGAAACFASAVIHPIDLLKVRIQVYQGARPPALQILRNVVATEGVNALYAGLSASLLRQAIYGTARLGMHRSFSDILADRNGGKAIPFWQKTCSGLLSGALAGIIGNPMDLSLVRMQADGTRPVNLRRNYQNVFDAIYRIAREEGFLTLWRGSAPMIARAMAMNVGMLATYDQAKQMITKVNGENFGTTLAASATAGFACAVTSLPFDLLKTRLMNMSVDPVTGKNPYSGLVDCAVKMVRTDGAFSLWRGFWTYYGRCAPHAMLILIVQESLNSQYEMAFNFKSVDWKKKAV